MKKTEKATSKKSTKSALLVFPMAALLNSFSMTALLIAFGIAGLSEIAADVGLVQGATLALFYAFSANARNLILADATGAVAIRLLQARLVLVLPLVGAALFLSVGIGATAAPLAIVLIVRRVSEWMGEIGLARHERMHQPVFALQTLVAEGVTFMMCLLLPLGFGFDLAASAIPWALAPLLAVRHAQLSWRGAGGNGITLRSLLPHFGSTAIIGTSVYVFRISIALLAGKAIAGDLFTAFAIGGMIPTIYGQALAPTLAHRFGPAGQPKWLLIIPATMFLLATGITSFALKEPGSSFALGQSQIFLLAVGLSIGGGALMSMAVARRTQLIQQSRAHEVFGPDLLANTLIATCVPFVFYVLGPRALAGLYALSGCLSLLFLLGVGQQWGWLDRHRKKTTSVIAFLLMFPMFFQIAGGLFRDTAFVFEAAGSIVRLPLPISVVCLFAGIALLGNYAAATRTLSTLFFTALFFVLTAISVSQSGSEELGAKLILLAQYLLPMFALVLGEMYGHSSRQPVFERAALWVLLLIVPAHLLSTWLQGYLLLAPSLYLFSIYQHLQYFPSVVVSLGLAATFFLWRGGVWQYWALLLLLPTLAVHAVASRSAVAMGSLLIGLSIVAIAQFRAGRLKRSLIVAMLAAAAFATIYGYMARSELASKFFVTPPGSQSLSEEAMTGAPQSLSEEAMTGAPQSLSEEAMTGAPQSLTDRVGHWRFYANGLTESPTAFLIGRASPPNRDKHPSAHNYWLDAMYNFGAVAVAPLVALLLWTVVLLWRRRSDVVSNPMLLGTALAAMYLLLGENMLKVGMRQPYPGIITFFIWGLLIARLHTPPSDEKIAITVR
jgi:hypothetical protein